MEQPLVQKQIVVYDLEEMADSALIRSSAGSMNASLGRVLESDDLDIGKWFQQKTVPEIKDESDDEGSERALSVEGTSSSYGPLEEIPYSAHNPNNDQIAGPDFNGIVDTSNTVIVPTGPPRSTAFHVPRRIEFMEGDQHELGLFPSYLYAQLRAYCRTAKTNYPDFIKSKWSGSSALNCTRSGNRAWFEIPDKQEVLLQARYLYDSRGQIVVVKPQPGSSFNKGKAAIVHFKENSSSGKSITRDGQLLYQFEWEIWNPLVPSDARIRVLRCVGGKSSRDKHLSNKTSKQDSDIATSADAEYSQSRDTSRQLKRKSSTSIVKGHSKKSRPTTISIDSSLLKPAYPITGKLGARRDLATGEMLMTRHSDGKLVTLRCTECDDDKTVNTQQGLLNHLASMHGDKLPNREALVGRCSIPVNDHPEPVSASASKSKSKPIVHQPPPLPKSSQISKSQTINDSAKSPTLPTSSTLLTSRRVSRLLGATPPPSLDSSEPSQNLAIEPQFVFRKTSNDPKPRIRPLSTINTAEKLFVNALVAGIARKDTLMLTIAVDDKDPLYIVQNDKEDFETILELVRRSKSKTCDIVVTVDDIA